MLKSSKTALASLFALGLPLAVISQQGMAQQDTEKVDLSVIHKIKVAELGGGGRGFGGGGGGRGNSQVMDTMYNLTDRFGPRLVNSPQFKRAGDWAVNRLKEWGMTNAHLEKWST